MKTCQYCYRREAVATMGDRPICQECGDVALPYYQCVECGENISTELGHWAFRQLERKVCEKEDCRHKNYVRRGVICCEKARYTACVCARSYICPDHHPEGVHVGSHE